MKIVTGLVAMALVLAGTGLCPAGVMNDRLYRLGEDDVPPAIPGNPGDPITTDSVGGINATKVGLTFYYGNTGGGLGLAPGSTEAMVFTNIDSRYIASATLGSVTQNFGMEGYVLVGPGVTNAIWFYNGAPNNPLLSPPSDGYGLGVSGGFYAAFISGAVYVSGVPANPLQPVEMALVNTGGNNFSVYVQDNLVLSMSALFSTPLATDYLSLGNFQGNYSPPAYSGIIDEARTFTFAPGAFNPATDLGAPAAAIPEPSAFVLSVIGAALSLVAFCRSQRRARSHDPWVPMIARS